MSLFLWCWKVKWPICDKIIRHNSRGGSKVCYNWKCLLAYSKFIIKLLGKVNISFYFHFVQLLSAGTSTFIKSNKLIIYQKKHEKTPSKNAHNRSKLAIFSVLPTGSNQPKSQFLFHKNCSLRDLCIMTLWTNWHETLS